MKFFGYEAKLVLTDSGEAFEVLNPFKSQRDTGDVFVDLDRVVDAINQRKSVPPELLFREVVLRERP